MGEEQIEQSDQMSITVRLARSLVEQMDQLAGRLSADPVMAPRGRLKRTEVLRLALVRGLGELERDLSADSSRR